MTKRFITPVAMLTFDESAMATPQLGHRFVSGSDLFPLCTDACLISLLAILPYSRRFHQAKAREGKPPLVGVGSI